MANETNRPAKQPAGKVLTGPKPMHWNLKMGHNVLKNPFGTGKMSKGDKAS